MRADGSDRGSQLPKMPFAENLRPFADLPVYEDENYPKLEMVDGRCRFACLD